MSLDEGLQQQRRAAIRRFPPAEALARVESGDKFVVVQDDFDSSFVPRGYTLVNMRHRGDSFRTLVPQSVLFYIANPGEGRAEDALEDIADFYGGAKDFEEGEIDDGNTSVQTANWSTLARGSYHTYLINRLIRHKRGAHDGEGEPAPEFNPEVLHQLDLDDSFVSQRVKAIAALALGKTADQINTHEVRDVLKHVTVGTRKERVRERLSEAEFQRVACYAGSHYELRPEFRNQGYDVGGNFSRSSMNGTRTYEKETDICVSILDSGIGELEGEIRQYREKKHAGTSGRHDSALIRQYTNLALIAPENPRAQLDITPPEKISEDGK